MRVSTLSCYLHRYLPQWHLVAWNEHIYSVLLIPDFVLNIIRSFTGNGHDLPSVTKKECMSLLLFKTMINPGQVGRKRVANKGMHNPILRNNI